MITWLRKRFRAALLRIGLLKSEVKPPVEVEPPRISDPDWVLRLSDEEHESILSRQLSDGVNAARYFKTVFTDKDQKNLAILWMKKRKEIEHNRHQTAQQLQQTMKVLVHGSTTR